MVGWLVSPQPLRWSDVGPLSPHASTLQDDTMTVDGLRRREEMGLISALADLHRAPHVSCTSRTVRSMADSKHPEPTTYNTHNQTHRQRGGQRHTERLLQRLSSRAESSRERTWSSRKSKRRQHRHASSTRPYKHASQLTRTIATYSERQHEWRKEARKLGTGREAQ